jgi:hypothetical protein
MTNDQEKGPFLTTDNWHLTTAYGDNRIRTGDPLLAKQVLYQLSYVPRDSCQFSVVSDRKNAISPTTGD